MRKVTIPKAMAADAAAASSSSKATTTTSSSSSSETATAASPATFSSSSLPPLKITIPGAKSDVNAGNAVVIEDADNNDDDDATTAAAAADAPQPGWLKKAKAHEAIGSGRPAGFIQSPNHHVIEIDSEQAEASGVNFPTLETNYDDLRPLLRPCVRRRG